MRMDSSWATLSSSFGSNSEMSSHCIKQLDIKQIAVANSHPRVFRKLLRNHLEHQQHFSQVLEGNEMSDWANMPAFKRSKWIDWNNYENYQRHSDARASQGATTMPEKATGYQGVPSCSLLIITINQERLENGTILN